MERNFPSVFLGGFECSCQLRQDGRRLDLLNTTSHDRLALADYGQLLDHGIRAARDGLRWHLIEREPGRYDWSSALPMLKAARQSGMEVIWDLCHYGWPSHLDIWSPDFPSSFARFAREAALVISDVSGAAPVVCPVNEISFWAWAGGEVGHFGPFAQGRGGELKRQLVRAWIAAASAMRDVQPAVRLICAEPAIHIDVGAVTCTQELAAVERNRLSQFEAVDLITGRQEPELGGSPEWLDVVGVNFYPDNQWYWGDRTIPLGHHAYRPFSAILAEWHGRYGKPLLIAETGSEGCGRASWLHYVCGEIEDAAGAGVPIEGVCIYPIIEYAGWDNDRHCRTGLLSAPDATGKRQAHRRLAAELKSQDPRLASALGRAGASAHPRLGEAA